MPNNLRGSEWRKWDLHVHTPASIVQEYGGEEGWEAYISALEALPPEVKVLGINDYIFVDGYERVLDYKKNGRLKNIDLILPVIELRVNRYTGNEQLRKLNYHVIFSDKVDVGIIKTQFINALSQNSNLQLNPDVGVEWNELVDKDSLTRLGQLVYDCTPEGTQKPSESKLKIGFNNISFSLENVESLLANNTAFKGEFLTAVGLREWDEFQWDGSPAEKRNLINGVDLIFSASPTSEKAKQHVAKFKANGVRHRVIHSSDAHKLAKDTDNTEPKELGHCYTWIKADTTFDGLRQVLYDYEDRVRLQDASPYTNDIKYVLDKITIQEGGVLHTQTIPINRDLVSIIGSKGSGKSLILSATSSISDLGDYETKNHKHPIFQDGTRSQIVHFDLIDKDNAGIEKHDIELNNGDDDYYSEPILYIAQEELAKRSKQPSRVRKEYLRELGIADLSIGYQDITDDTEYNLEQIDALNAEFKDIKLSVGQDLEDKALVEHLEKKIKNLELTNEKLSNDKTKKVIGELSTIIAKGQEANLWQKDDGFKDIDLMVEDVNERIATFNTKAKVLGVEEENLLPLIEVETLQQAHEKSSTAILAKLKDLRVEYEAKKTELEELGVSEDISTLLKTVENVQRDIATYKKSLERARSIQEIVPKKQQYLSDLFDPSAIIHSRITERTAEINEKFTTFQAERKASSIFEKLFKNIGVEAGVFFNYRKLEADILECFYANTRKPSVAELHKTIFGEKEPTYANYFEWVSKSFWSFYGKYSRDLKEKTSSGLNGVDRLKKVILLDWYEYVSVSVNITHQFGDDNKEIDIMSTGELATVLLKLILVTQGLDKQIILLDQPEDHLDNEFIAGDLVELIRTLKKMRQIIMVTHNANLVVMTDSEQVIIANGVNKEYLSGGIENPDIKDGIVRILEGGLEAFNKRHRRYGRS